jgi:tetratricopeptide (TPR) repeat protein
MYLDEIAAGKAAYDKGDWTSANASFARAGDLAEKSPATAETFTTAMTLKGVKAAAPALSQSIDVWTLVLGPEHPTVLTGLFQMAYIYYLNDNYKLGDEAVNRALKAYKSSGKQLPESAETWLAFIPQLLTSKGERDRAAQTYKRIVSSHMEVLGKNSPVVARYQLDEANAFGLRRQYKQGISLAEHAVETGKFADAKTRAYAVRRLAWINAQAGNYSTAENLYLKCIEILSGESDKLDLHKAQNDLCAFYEEYGGFDKTAKLRQHIYDALKQEGAAANLVNSAAHDLLSVWQARDAERAIKLAKTALAGYDSDLGPASPESGHLMHHLAFCQANLNRVPQARSACNWGMALLAWDAQGRVRNVIDDLSRFADRLSSIGDDSGARKALEKGLKLARGNKEQEEWGVQETPEALALKNIANWMRSHGDDGETMKAYDDAIAAMRAAKRKDDTSIGQYRLYQTEAALERKDIDAAKKAAVDAENIYSQWTGERSSRRARLLALRARAAAAAKNAAEARRLEQESASIVAAAAGEDPYDASEVYLELGRLCLDDNRLDDAQRYFQQTLSIKEQVGTPGDIAQARAFDGQALVALRKGDAKKAGELSARALKVLDQVCFKTPYVVPIAAHHIDLLKRTGNQDKKLPEARARARSWAVELFGPEHTKTREIEKL